MIISPKWDRSRESSRPEKVENECHDTLNRDGRHQSQEILEESKTPKRGCLKKKSVATEILVFDFELFIGVRFWDKNEVSVTY
jgi:hypothetical protein